MLFIGITGGVGAGKTEILNYLQSRYHCRILLADRIAQELMEPGTDCYRKLTALFADDDVFLPGGGFDRGRLAGILFADHAKREALNAIVHPAVHEYVMAEVEKERLAGKLDFVILEAALLIETGYAEDCDELWYIYTDREIRKKRLMASRGYSEEKSEAIMASQLSEETFRKYCKEEINNSGTVEESFAQIDRILDQKGVKKETGDDS